MRVCLLIALFLVVSSSAPVAAEDSPAQRYHYLITFMGSTVGWATFSFSETEFDGKPATLETQQSYIVIQREHDSQRFELRGTSQVWYASGWRKLRKLDVMVSGPQTRRVETVWDETITLSVSIDDGEPHRLELAPGETPVYGFTQAWKILRGEELVPGRMLEFQSVDGEGFTLRPETWTVSGSVRQRLVSGTLVEGTEVRMIRGGRAATAIFGDEPLPLLFRDTSGFALERTPEIPQPFEPEPVAMRNAMRADIVISEFRKLQSMEIRFKYDHSADEGLGELIDANAYHDVRRLDDGYALLLKAQPVPETAAGLSLPLKDIDEGVKRFLLPTPMCQSEDEQLVAVAKKLIEGHESAADAVRAIKRYVSGHLRPESGATGAASAKQAWLERKGDCTEHAALFVTLARAAGIPARNAGGLVYLAADRQALFGFHAWAEVWLGQWVPVDTTVNEFGLSARYVLLEYDEPGITQGRGRFSRMLGQNIEPEIHAWGLTDNQSWRREGSTSKFE